VDGAAFIDALKVAIEPATIDNMKGEPTGVVVSLSDGRVIKINRKHVATLQPGGDPDEVSQYIQTLLA